MVNHIGIREQLKIAKTVPFCHNLFLDRFKIRLHIEIYFTDNSQEQKFNIVTQHTNIHQRTRVSQDVVKKEA